MDIAFIMLEDKISTMLSNDENVISLFRQDFFWLKANSRRVGDFQVFGCWYITMKMMMLFLFCRCFVVVVFGGVQSPVVKCAVIISLYELLVLYLHTDPNEQQSILDETISSRDYVELFSSAGHNNLCRVSCMTSLLFHSHKM